MMKANASILLLHPGDMGSSVGAALHDRGHKVYWISQGRSAATEKRATRAGLIASETLSEAIKGVDLVISVCPPEFALAVATQVQQTGYAGLYVDGNAVSPGTMFSIEALFGDRLIDGGIIGPPAWRPGVMRFYLSGSRAAQVAALFEGSMVDARVCAGGVGRASALKMAYAAFTKGSSALLLAVRAMAEHYGVSEALVDEWTISSPDLIARSEKTAAGTSPKAWRFEGEMLQIANSFSEAGLPHQFHEGAAALYHRMANFKDKPPAELETVIAALLKET